MGCQVSVIIVVDQNADGNFINPYSLDGLGAHNYYGLNAHTTEGAEMLAAAASFLANRWTGRGFGQVDNFIIGNEVNAWHMWNYMRCPSNDVFVAEYVALGDPAGANDAYLDPLGGVYFLLLHRLGKLGQYRVRFVRHASFLRSSPYWVA